MMLFPTTQTVQAKTAAKVVAAVILAMLLMVISSGGLSAEDHTIEIKSFKFKPTTLTVRPGDTITWINRDIAPHTATALDKSWDTGRLKKGQAYKLIVTAGMDTNYFCRFHPQMKASLSIQLDK